VGLSRWPHNSEACGALLASYVSNQLKPHSHMNTKLDRDGETPHRTGRLQPHGEEFSPQVVNHIRSGLEAWWASARRDYPWRHTRDPYRVLVAEVLLHRTRADQVVPVYIHVLTEYPTVQSLAGAELEHVRAIMHPLGLRWRADLMHAMAQEIVASYGGNIPASRRELEKLPGIGPYAAAALLCFAFGKPEPLLDVNTVRIVGRILGIQINDSHRRSKRFHRLLTQLVDPRAPRAFNFAMLDLGALVCRSSGPRCDSCPLLAQCTFGQQTTPVS